MTGNTVDGSIAASVRLTNTGGSSSPGARDSKTPWPGPVADLAISAADNVLYLVETTSSEPTSSRPDVSRATSVVARWRKGGATR
jgi:hypothetical protein